MIAGASGVLSAYSGSHGLDDIIPASSWTFIAGLDQFAGSWVKTGIYKTTFTLPSSASIFNSFRDVWTITSSSSAVTPTAVQVFLPIDSPSAEANYVNFDTVVTIPYWPKTVSQDSILTKKVYIWERAANVSPLAQSEENSISSIASSTLTNYISTSGYYRILVDALGVVDIDWQQLGYDANSNFFTLDFSNFARGIKYNLEFKLNLHGQTIIYDKQPYQFVVE
jgi:hypothetical protein